MKVQLLVALVFGIVAIADFAQCIILLTTGTAAATTGLTVSGVGLAAGAAAVGALALGAVAAVALSRRGKREAVGCLPFNNPELFFSMAANSDILDCGRRFVCELEATDDINLAEEELLIRNLFARQSSSVSGPSGGFFADAGLVGSTNGTAACVATYSSCPFDRKTIFLAFKQAQKV